METDMLETIKTRRSIRQFTSAEVDDSTIDRIIEMGTWAPSGLNNQPWKFVIVKNKATIDALSSLTRYSHIVKGAPVLIAVFLDNAQSYNRIKDIQAVGACIQNMLLAIHALGLGGVWLGEILNNRKSVETVLKAPEGCELMAVVAFGRSAQDGGPGNRKPVEEMILGRDDNF